MRGWVVAMIALAGCDRLFDLQELTLDGDASMDAKVFLDAPTPCPEMYVPFPDAPKASRYRWVGNNVAWDVAEQDCESHSNGITHLVVFDDPDEMTAVRDQLDSMFFTFASHTGYARNVTDDFFQFYAVTGEALPVSGAPWAMMEPSGLVEETTTRFETFADLTDQPPDALHSYLCECDHRPVEKRFVLR